MSVDRIFKTTAVVAVFALLLTSLPGCQKEGPAERAGKAVDNATDKVGQQIEKVGDSLQDATGKRK